jgi:hypothetical protein
MTADFIRFAAAVWPYAGLFVAWIAACAVVETTR